MAVGHVDAAAGFDAGQVVVAAVGVADYLVVADLEN